MSATSDDGTTTIPSRTLNDATTLPEIGFGTSSLRGRGGATAVSSALQSGYRLLDTAYNYENEGAIGAGISRSGVARDQIRVTSKLPGRYQAYDDAVQAVQESLYRCGLEWFDLYLIHWPNPEQGLYSEAWRALVDLREQGLLRSIGVSNFLPEHIDQLVRETGVTPSVNQIEVHPWFPQDEALAWNADHGVATEAWSPVGRSSNLQQDPDVAAIARELGKSPVQVILRWQLDRGTIPLPKSADAQRQRENLAVFDFSLTEEHHRRIAGLARADGRLAGQDPAIYEEF